MKDIVKFSIKLYQVIDDRYDIINNHRELNEQICADLYFGGINAEIKEQVIQELADKLTSIGDSIIVLRHE